jgi:di-N-acetylchitobiase
VAAAAAAEAGAAWQLAVDAAAATAAQVCRRKQRAQMLLLALLCCCCYVTPCGSAAGYCDPRPLATALPKREILVYWAAPYSASSVPPSMWQRLDWGHLTTLAVFHPWPPPKDLVCYAHSRGARVVYSDGTQWMHTTQRSNHTARAAWIAQHVSQMVSSGTDGVNVDLEAFKGGLNGSKNSVPNAAAPLLTSLLAELRLALLRANSRAQLSLASQVWPTSYPAYYYGGYNYTAIANHVDFFVVMAYDMVEDNRLSRRGTPHSFPVGHWDEHANTPLPGIAAGVAQYNMLGVPASQLVVALPFYGYQFACTNNSVESFCAISGDMVHGCPRSACPQISFGEIEAFRIINSTSSSSATAVGPLRFDATTTSVYIEFVNGSGVRHQIWYDNPTTIAKKSAWVANARLRGVGAFEASMLYCPASKHHVCALAQREPQLNASIAAMWTSLSG